MVKSMCSAELQLLAGILVITLFKTVFVIFKHATGKILFYY